ncbi:hypothetical protein [Castellaniella sp. GW247-6E4]|uniref:hypothetical protein n=1 Tax=Castellaniella sp. GW247-6E4 TaxID=3140380 RepID=UPI0033157A7C
MARKEIRPVDAAGQTERPWWRHRWPWLLMLGPALAVVGCIITIVLAFQSYGDQAIQDGGVRRGLHVSPPAQDRPGHRPGSLDYKGDA